MPLRAEFVDFDDELSLPVFVPAGAAAVGEGHLMDFAFTDEQLAVSEAATGTPAGLVDPERVAGVEQSDERIDRDLWQALAGADLLGLAVARIRWRRRPRAARALPLARGAGQRRPHRPLWSTLVLGALPLARFGSGDQKQRGCPGSSPGDTVLTAALNGDRGQPHVDAARLGRGRTATGGSSTASSSPCPRRTSATRDRSSPLRPATAAKSSSPS